MEFIDSAYCTRIMDYVDSFYMTCSVYSVCLVQSPHMMIQITVRCEQMLIVVYIVEG